MAQKQSKQLLTVKKLPLRKVILKFPEQKMGNPYHKEVNSLMLKKDFLMLRKDFLMLRKELKG
jgi:hypothetical protein